MKMLNIALTGIDSTQCGGKKQMMQNLTFLKGEIWTQIRKDIFLAALKLGCH